MECLLVHRKVSGQTGLPESEPPPSDSASPPPAEASPASTMAAAASCPDNGPAAPDAPLNVNSQTGGHLVGAMQVARQSGRLSAEDLEASARFPVTRVVPAGAAAGAPGAPVHTYIGYKQIQEIKAAVRDYGLQSRYVLGLLTSLSTASMAMSLADWQSLLGMILTPAQYAIWNSEYGKQAAIAIAAGLPQNVAADQMLGSGAAATIAQQPNADPATFPILNPCAPAALRKVDDDQGTPSQTFSKIVQAPTEDYSSFVSRLQIAPERQIDNGEARNELCMKLAYENANPDCQKVLQPIANKPGITLADFLPACRIVGTTSHKNGCAGLRHYHHLAPAFSFLLPHPTRRTPCAPPHRKLLQWRESRSFQSAVPRAGRGG